MEQLLPKEESKCHEKTDAENSHMKIQLFICNISKGFFFNFDIYVLI